MANICPKISAKEFNGAILVYEVTGRYDASNNPGGFGGSNPSISKIISSKLYAMGPNDSDYREVIDVTGDLPNTENTPREILPEYFAQTELISGKYSFKIIHTVGLSNGTTQDFEGDTIEIFTDNIKCCISKLGYPSGKLENAEERKKTELNLLLDGVMDMVCKGYYNEAAETIEYLNGQCKCSGCR